MLLVALAVVLAGIAAWALLHRSGSPVSGGIVLKALHCSSSTGVAKVDALALNDTNTTLHHLVARVTIGASGSTKTDEVSFDTVLRGGSIQVQRSIPYPGEINVCFVKFWWNGTQLNTAFQP